MSRAEKLIHWAGLVRAYMGRLACIISEHRQPEHATMTLCTTTPHSPRGARSGSDRAGFHGQNRDRRHEVLRPLARRPHAFSCNCGGEISNRDQAARIDGLPAAAA